MYHIQKTTSIKTSEENVIYVLTNPQKFHLFMRNVKNIESIKLSDTVIRCKWFVDIDGAELIWEEKITYNLENSCAEFSMIAGDYNNYYGRWEWQKKGNKTLLTIKVTVDWDIPSLEKIIGPILEEKTRKLIRGMLAAIKVNSQKINQMGYAQTFMPSS